MDIKTLRLMNASMIIYLNKLGINTQRNEIIKKILENDACFFLIDKKDAYSILEDIGISKEKISHVYSHLISYDEYLNLIKSGKIKNGDKNLKITYKKYNPNDIFKNKK